MCKYDDQTGERVSMQSALLVVGTTEAKEGSLLEKDTQTMIVDSTYNLTKVETSHCIVLKLSQNNQLQ